MCVCPDQKTKACSHIYCLLIISQQVSSQGNANYDVGCTPKLTTNPVGIYLGRCAHTYLLIITFFGHVDMKCKICALGN